MPIDWDQFESDLDDVLDDAERDTDAALAGRFSSVTRLTDAEILALCPKQGDAARLKELLVIVNSATAENQRVASLADRFHALGTMVVRLLTRVT